MRAAVVMMLVVCLMPVAVGAVDEPPHQVVLSDGKLELRQYQPKLVAEVTVNGNMRSAGSRGFKSLAGYIFGDNQSAGKIQMTAPVSRSKSTKIAMTAPVSRIENDDTTWTIAFVMPKKWTLETLPKPNNPDVTIREVPSELVAAIRFSGRGSEASHKEKQGKLEKWISEQGYVATGPPSYAGYDAPWTPWPLRRNEVMISVAKPG